MLDFITTPYAIEDLEKLKTAGATSIVIAVPFFSVRGVHNFEIEELPQIKKECERLGLRMYTLVNRFFTEEELPALREHLLFLMDVQVDGIYYGDECVLFEAKRLGIENKLIYNPDTLITNHQDVQYYIDEGIQFVTISKEITMDEICSIQEQVNGSCEVILHGRVNMMHSKRTLLSSYMNFINKEEHVHDNKQLYLMEETREEHMPIIEDDLGTHVFSGYTLASFVELPKMIEAGIEHVRIDGMFHDIDYVCEAVSLYRDIMEGKRNGQDVFDAYAKKYAQDNVTTGFYYTRTSKVKEG